MELLGLVTPRIQEYVIQLATAQYIRDNYHKIRHKELWTDVCKEILIYAELKRLCGKGHIRFMIEPDHLLGHGDANIVGSTGDKKHLVIMGRHVVMSPVHGPRTEEAFINFKIKNAYRGIERFYNI